MHHAVPSECPLPRVAGPFSPVTPDEWLDSKGNNGYAAREEILHYTRKSAQSEIVHDFRARWIEHMGLLVTNRRRQMFVFASTHAIANSTVRQEQVVFAFVFASVGFCV